jgi:hypothetical protein
MHLTIMYSEKSITRFEYGFLYDKAKNIHVNLEILYSNSALIAEASLRAASVRSSFDADA